jgi:hypothetical protein
MITKTVTLAMAVLVGTTAFASANINGRQYHQNYRIWKGVASGEIQYGEYKRLQRGQDRVQRLENIIKRDGYVSPFERSVMRAYQNYQSDRIYRYKHN